MFTGIDIMRCDIAEFFVVAPVVVIVDEGPYCLERFARHFVGNQFYLSFDSTVIPFYLTVGLRMIR